MKFYVKRILTACYYNNITFKELINKVGLNHYYNLTTNTWDLSLLDLEKIKICQELNTVMPYFYGYLSDDLLHSGKLTLDKYKEAVDSYTLDSYFKEIGLDWTIDYKTINECNDRLFLVEDSPTLTRAELNSAIACLNKGKSSLVNVHNLPVHEEVYIALLRTQPLLLKDIKKQTEDVCLTAIQQFAHAIEFVHTQTEKIALAAVVKNGLVLEFVEPQFHTERVVKAAIKQNPLSFKFSTLKTEEICSLAIRENGINYEFVPEEFRTHELKMEALKSNGWAIKFFDEQTEEYAITAVLQNTESCLHIDEDIRENNTLIKSIYSEIIKNHAFLMKNANSTAVEA